jgi:hypothetical protein
MRTVDSDRALTKSTVIRDLVAAKPSSRFNSRLVIVLPSSGQEELRIFVQKTDHGYVSAQSVHEELQQARQSSIGGSSPCRLRLLCRLATTNFAATQHRPDLAIFPHLPYPTAIGENGALVLDWTHILGGVQAIQADLQRFLVMKQQRCSAVGIVRLVQ